MASGTQKAIFTISNGPQAKAEIGANTSILLQTGVKETITEVGTLSLVLDQSGLGFVDEVKSTGETSFIIAPSGPDIIADENLATLSVSAVAGDEAVAVIGQPSIFFVLNSTEATLADGDVAIVLSGEADEVIDASDSGVVTLVTLTNESLSEGVGDGGEVSFSLVLGIGNFVEDSGDLTFVVGGEGDEAAVQVEAGEVTVTLSPSIGNFLEDAGTTPAIILPMGLVGEVAIVAISPSASYGTVNPKKGNLISSVDPPKVLWRVLKDEGLVPIALKPTAAGRIVQPSISAIQRRQREEEAFLLQLPLEETL